MGVGSVVVKWQNTFGDLGDIVFGPFIYMGESDKDNKETTKASKAKNDETVWIQVAPVVSPSRMLKTELDIDAEAIKNITIHGLP